MMAPVKHPVKPVQGKRLIIGLLGAIILVGALLFWVGLNGGSTHVPLSKPGVGFVTDDAGSSSSANAPDAPDSWDGGPIGKTVADPKVRAELRKRILAGWAAEGSEEQAAAAR